MMKRMARRELLPVWLWLAALLIGAVLVTRTHFTADMSAFLPRSPTPEQQLLVDQLRDGLVSRLILVGIEGGDLGTRAEVSGKMAAQLRADKRFTTVGNGESAGMQRDQAFLFAHRYQLSPAVTPAHFTVEGLRAAIGETLDLLASPAGLLTKSLLPRDPTGEVPLLLEEFSGDGTSGANRPNVAGGVWASRDGNRALLLVQTAASGSDTDAQEEALHAVQSAFSQARGNAAAGANLTLVATGPGVFAVQARDTIKREVTRTSVVSMALMFTLLMLIYRSFTTLALGMVPVVSGTVAGVVAVSLGFGEVHGITLGFGTTLIGEAVDYSIYLFVQSERTATSKTDWVRRFWPTIRLGVLTSVAGFASLLFSGFPGLAQLGLYSIVGLLTAAAVTRFVMPLLLPAGFRVRDVTPLGERLSGWVGFAPRLKWLAAALLALACVPLAMHRDQLWNHELSGLSPISLAEQMQDTARRARRALPGGGQRAPAGTGAAGRGERGAGTAGPGRAPGDHRRGQPHPFSAQHGHPAGQARQPAAGGPAGRAPAAGCRRLAHPGRPARAFSCRCAGRTPGPPLAAGRPPGHHAGGGGGWHAGAVQRDARQAGRLERPAAAARPRQRHHRRRRGSPGAGSGPVRQRHERAVCRYQGRGGPAVQRLPA